jgi:7-cyano-7-deazaguanine synthase
VIANTKGGKVMSKCLVTLSGGQDSTTCLFWAKQHFEDVKSISFDYGQRHRAELNSAIKIASLADVSHEIVDVTNVLVSRSPLTDASVPLETYNNYQEMDKIIGDRVELTFVPMRNAFFLTVAANRALHDDAYNLVTGVCQMDNANYPDCRDNFIHEQEKTINMALGIGNFKIWTPLIHLTKAETVKLAKTLPGCFDALAYSHTCYFGSVPPCILTEKTACHACTLRAEGFKQAGCEDPLIERFKTVTK